MEKTAREIPLDLITDILSRVSSKNLIRFKLVSKPWNSLIQDTVFAHLHLRRSEALDTRKLIKICRYKYNAYSSKDGRYKHNAYTLIYSIDNCGIASTINPKPYFNHVNFTSSPSCNGLLCYVTPESEIQVSNPITGETITLPKPSFLQDTSLIEIAIGFDPLSKVYKIVGWSKGRDLVVEIFTLGTNSWRKITGNGNIGIPIRYFYCDEPIYVDGVSYWHFLKWATGIIPFKNEIVYFDYVEEKFGTIHVPNDINNWWLCESQGHLCIGEKQEKKSAKEETWVIILWMLNKYEDGRQEWKCQPPINVPCDDWYSREPSEILAIGSGEIIMDRGRCHRFFLDSYNDQGQIVNSIELEISKGFKPFHIGSLVRLT